MNGEMLNGGNEESMFFSVPTMHPNLVSTLKSVISTPQNAHQSNPFHHNDDDIAVVPLDLIQNRRPFKCSQQGCLKTFKNPQTLNMHQKTHFSHPMPCLALNPNAGRAGQNKKIPCRCPVCHRAFVGLYELRRHFGRKHSEGEKTHACKNCGKGFYVDVDLREHEKLCGEPMECKCGMRFKFKCHLVAHRKTHPQ